MGGPGSGGANAKPTAIKVLTGNPGKKKLPKGEPKPPSDEPAMPDWLSETARKKWLELIPLLRHMNLLSQADGEMLATYCQAWSEFRRCTIMLEEEGTVYEARQGLIPRPEVAIRDRAVNQLRQIAHEFGLTPSARARMVMPGNRHDDDDIDDMLNQPLRKAQ